MAPRVQAGGQGLRSHRPTEGSGGLESRYDRQGEQQEEVEELPPPPPPPAQCGAFNGEREGRN